MPSSDCELPRHRSTPQEIRDMLTRHRVVAVVGLSTDESKPSYHVAEYLSYPEIERGGILFPVVDYGVIDREWRVVRLPAAIAAALAGG